MLFNPKWKKPKQRKKSKRPTTRAAIYEAAADAIEEHGHCRHWLVDHEGRMCLWGAIAFAMTGSARNSGDRPWHMMRELIQFTGGSDPVTWNNRPTRTKRQVVNLLRKAANHHRR